MQCRRREWRNGRTFEDPNYVNTIGSKVVIRPLAETLELSIKKDQLLQRTMVHTGPATASPDVSGDLPSGELHHLGGEVSHFFDWFSPREKVWRYHDPI